MARDNSKRLKSPHDPVTTSNTNSPLTFSTPTDFVELPSKGIYYAEGHPLHNEEVIEIRYMTAKDEDILTSQSLLKKGIAIDRLLQNVIVDRNIKIEDLLIGDKNAVIIACRKTGYGSIYETQATCPGCSTTAIHSFDLECLTVSSGGSEGSADVTSQEDTGTFLITTPISNVRVELKLLTGQDENYLSQLAANKRKGNLPESGLTDQLQRIIVSVNGHTDLTTLRSFVENMPAKDSRYIRQVYEQITPNIDLAQGFTCESCGYETDRMEVPFTATFFWPKR